MEEAQFRKEKRIMLLRVEFPAGYRNEQNYVAHCLLGSFLGLDYVTAEMPSTPFRSTMGPDANWCAGGRPIRPPSRYMASSPKAYRMSL